MCEVKKVTSAINKAGRKRRSFTKKVRILSKPKTHPLLFKAYYPIPV